MYTRIIEGRSRNHCCRGTTIRITRSQCACIQHAKRIDLFKPILASVASPAQQHFSTSSHNRHDFREGKLQNVKCVF